MLDKSTPNQIPPGLKLRRTIVGHNDVIKRLAWSPDGRVLASTSADHTISLWEAETGELYRTFRGHGSTVYGAAWSPKGDKFASCSAGGSIRIWDVLTGKVLRIITGHSATIISVAWSPDGETIASGSNDRTVRLWDAKTGKMIRKLADPHLLGLVQCVTWSPDGRWLAIASFKPKVLLWDTKTGVLSHTLEGHFRTVYSVAWSPDGRRLATGSRDDTIRLWDVETESPSFSTASKIEWHTHSVTSVSFSPDSQFLASKSRDDTVCLWDCKSIQQVAEFDESHSKRAISCLAFHPVQPVLATLGEKDRVIRIWDVDFDLLRNSSIASETELYTNAKVVLVGDSGVGKTGLGVRLAERVWRPTPGSTHGMNVWTLHSRPDREVMLWDFAGQDEYRLVHQLFLNQTNVALLLYDPTKSNDTFFGIEYWEKALENGVQGEVRKILVAARVNVGRVRMVQDDIKAYCKARGYRTHFVTSAETNEGCDELRNAIMAAIPWAQLPRTSSPDIFRRIKEFLISVRQGNRILARESDLQAEFSALAGVEGAPTKDEFRTVIGHVETTGLIKRLSFGDFVLLRPELLNGYAADIVDAARLHKHGLGAVRKADVLDGRIKLKDAGGLNTADKIFLLHATVELFLRLGLALEQDGNLVFPSKFNRQMPPLAEDPVVEVEFAFEGPVENLYTTLVVKLYYGGIFRLKKLWKNAAEFLNARERVCGFQLHSEGDGRGTLKVFYAEGVSDDDKALFLKIVADHFKEKGTQVRRQRIYRCPNPDCRELVRDRQAVDRALARSVREMPCLYCFKNFSLLDALEILYSDDAKFLAQITAMEGRAEASIERGGELISASAEIRSSNFKEWARGADIATVAIVFTDMLDSTKLNVEFGDDPWRQVRESHFARANELIMIGQGYPIKTIGDAVMAAFHNATNALAFALDLCQQTGHESAKICAGIHIGSVEVTSSDAFGQQVSMAARIQDKAKKGGGVWVSAQVKEDIDTLRASKHSQLKWTVHPDQELRGFPKKYTLWSVEC